MPQDIWTLIALLGHAKHRKHWDTRPAEIRELLAQGADPNAGRGAPLQMAVQMGHLEIVKVLLEFGADVHGGRIYGTPLVAAAQQPEIRDYLLQHGARETPFNAVAEGNADKLKADLDADPSLVHLRDEEDMTLLFYAAESRDVEVMKLLLEAGADPDAVAEGCYRISPIHQACRGGGAGSEQAVALLARHGADLNARDKGGVTALHMAVRDRDVPAVRALLEHGADPDIEDRGRRSTPLRRAVANTGRGGTGGKAALEITRLLLAHGADPNHVNRSGKPVIESTRNPAIRAVLEEAMARGKQ